MCLIPNQSLGDLAPTHFKYMWRLYVKGGLGHLFGVLNHCVRVRCVRVRGQGACVWCACLCVGRVERRTNVLGLEKTVFVCESMFARSVPSAALSTRAHRSDWMRLLLLVQLKSSKRARINGSVGSRPNQSSGDLGPTHFKDMCGDV